MVDAIALTEWATTLVKGWYYLFFPVIGLILYFIYKEYKLIKSLEKSVKHIDKNTSFIANYEYAYIKRAGGNPEEFFPKEG